MVCRENSKVRVHPGHESSQFVRVNGLTRPIHYLQVVAWTIILVFILVFFGVAAPAVSMPWKPAAFVCTGLLFIVHVITHVIATTKNPADQNAKAQIKKKHQMPEFDRSKHQHVIEDEYCHLCETFVSVTSKHCRACNKCVLEFDHHCLWLNNCVGGLNYKYFLTTIATAFLGTLVILTVCSFVFVNSLLDFQLLDEGVWWKTTVPELFQVFMGIVIVLCLICSILLAQLLFFHLYLIRRGLTTYEYIQNSRAKKEGRQSANSVNEIGTSNSVENEMGACTRPPSIIDTAVVSTSNGAVVVKASTVEKEEKTPSSLPVTTANSSATNTGAENEVVEGEELQTSSHAEFTNAAFSSDESKNANMNSNAKVIPQLSVNGKNGHASSLGELQNWGKSLKPESEQSHEKRKLSHLNEATSTMTPDSKDNPEHLVLPIGDKSHHRKKRRSSKKMLLSKDDAIPRPLPVLPENSNPSLSHSSLRKKVVLPPLRNSVDWASSTEDLHSVVSSQRKLPSLTPSSSVNSFASFASSSMVSNRGVNSSHA